MHKLRKALEDGSVPEFDSPLADKPSVQVSVGGKLGSVVVARDTTRQTNHRNEDRYPFEDEQAQATWRDKTIEVNVTNFSSNGIQIETDHPAEIAERITVALGNCDPINCVVRWVREGRMGLEFDAETQILADNGVINYIVENIQGVFIASGEQVEGRVGVERRSKESRHGMIWIGSVEFDNFTCMARLRNISGSGAMLQIDSMCLVKPGKIAKLDLGEAGEVSGEVVWSAGLEIGMRFEEPFDVSLLSELPAVDVNAIEDEEYDGDFEEEFEDDRQYSNGTDITFVDGEPRYHNWSVPDHIRPPNQHGRLTLDEVYATLYPNGRPQPTEAEDDEGGADTDPPTEVMAEASPIVPTKRPVASLK